MKRTDSKKIKPGKSYIGLGVGAVILNDQEEILLLRRSSSLSADRTTVGMWSIPGGEVEFGERIEDAVQREIKEELGIDIKIIKIIGNWDQILPKTKIHWHCISFLCTILKGKPIIKEPGKFTAIRWFPLNKIPKNAGIAHVAIPLHLLGKMSTSEFKKRLKTTPES